MGAWEEAETCKDVGPAVRAAFERYRRKVGDSAEVEAEPVPRSLPELPSLHAVSGDWDSFKARAEWFLQDLEDVRGEYDAEMTRLRRENVELRWRVEMLEAELGRS